jgi:putative peptidoglycan lipid II flippase
MVNKESGKESIGPTPSEEAGRLVRSSTALSVVALLSVATSFLWDVAIAARFGIGARSDAFYFAYTLPSIITSLVYLASYSILVPAVARRLGSGEREAAWRLFSTVANVIFLLAAVIGLGGVVGSYGLVRVLAPGFGGRTASLAAEMSMILFATLAVAVAFEVLRTGLYACNRLVIPTALNILFNLTIVAFVVVAGPALGVRSAALGVAAGKIFQLAIIVFLLFRVPGFRYHWSLRLRDPGVMDTLRALLAPLSGMGARQIVILVERLLASTLPAGSMTALSYGNRVGTVVGTVYYDSITTALLPALSVHVSRRDLARVRENLLAGVKLVTFMSLPAVVLLVLLRETVARVLFQRGQVEPAAVSLTATILAIYAVSLLTMGHFRVLQNYFYAAESRGTVILLFALAALSNLVLDLTLVHVWGAQGIAAAFVLSSALVMAVGYVLMWPKAGGWPWRELGIFAGRVLAGGILCVGAVVVVQMSWPVAYRPESDTGFGAVYLAVAGGLGMLAYLAVSLITQREEAGRMLALARRRVGGGGNRVAVRLHPSPGTQLGGESDGTP